MSQNLVLTHPPTITVSNKQICDTGGRTHRSAPTITITNKFEVRAGGHTDPPLQSTDIHLRAVANMYASFVAETHCLYA